MEKITDALKQHMTLSFEVFPPKQDQPLDGVLATLAQLYQFKPDFCSVTYGAGGSNRGQNMEICSSIIDHNQTAMAHLTCIGNTKTDIQEIVHQYEKIGIKNILALRGDIPAGWDDTQGDFSFASDLIRALRIMNPNLCIASSCNPEVHKESRSLDSDIMHLRMKMDAGTDFFVTQLFFDNEAFYRYRDRMTQAGIHRPIIVGIMPVLNPKAIIKMTLSNGVSIPAPLSCIFAKYQDSPEDFRKAGRDYTIEQITNLISNHIDGLHLYSLNKWETVTEILHSVGFRR